MKKILFFLSVLFFSPLLASAQNTSEHNFQVAKNLDVFNAIYRNLDLMYVDTLDADKAVGTAIRAMLGSLDPYTEYYPEDKVGEYKTMMTGKYAGIGSIISYSFTRKHVVINEPYEGMPAAEAGLKKGDVILSIDGESMEDKTTAYVSDHLRGDAGTTMVLKIMRPSTGKKLTFKVQRRAIQMAYLPYYGLQPDGIGYINYNQFVENSAKDVRRAFIDMRGKGMKGLVLDLRNNGGGSVQEAIQILNMFIPKGKQLLEMRGKVKKAHQTYSTTVEPIDTVMPIVVLVNDGTASASEITSGALQDLDRAVVLGTRTYGKGLVQVPDVPLPYNGKLKLTTAKYYIPSGRCIQARSYKHTYLSRVDTTDIMLNYEIDYIAKHPTVAKPSEFELSDADYEQFKQLVIKSGFTYDQVSEKYLKDLEKLARFEGYYEDAKPEFEALSKKLQHNIVKDLDYPYNKQKIKEMIASDLMSAYYFERGAIENSLRNDKQMKEAVKLLKDAEAYKKLLMPSEIEKKESAANAKTSANKQKAEKKTTKKK